MFDEPSDAELVAACASGDLGALGALFDRFHGAVARFAARLPALDRAARDDLVQATFLAVRRAARSYRGRAPVEAWLLGIAADRARHALHAERRRRAHQALLVDDAAASPALDDRLDDQVERRRLLARIAGALAGLPRDQQVAFVLCDVEQLPGVEVARALAIPPGTLWRRLHDARKALRRAVARSA